MIKLIFNTGGNFFNYIIYSTYFIVSQIFHYADGSSKNKSFLYKVDVYAENVREIEVSNQSFLITTNKKVLERLKINSGKVILTNENTINEIILENGAFLKTNFDSLLPLKIIMEKGTIYNFSINNLNYQINAPNNNFIFENGENIIKVARFFDNFFLKNNKNKLDYNHYEGFRAYKKLDKNILEIFMQQNYPNFKNLYEIDYFINSHLFDITTICKTSPLSECFLGSDFQLLPPDMLPLIGSWISLDDILFS